MTFEFFNFYFKLISDWDHTHKVCERSTYYKGHLDSKNHKIVMNCTYYIKFEQKFKKHQWWIDKKARIEQTIKDFDSKDPTVKDRAEAQTKVRILKRFVRANCNFILAKSRSG